MKKLKLIKFQTIYANKLHGPEYDHKLLKYIQKGVVAMEKVATLHHLSGAVSYMLFSDYEQDMKNGYEYFDFVVDVEILYL